MPIPARKSGRQVKPTSFLDDDDKEYHLVQFTQDNTFKICEDGEVIRDENGGLLAFYKQPLGTKIKNTHFPAVRIASSRKKDELYKTKQEREAEFKRNRIIMQVSKAPSKKQLKAVSLEAELDVQQDKETCYAKCIFCRELFPFTKSSDIEKHHMKECKEFGKQKLQEDDEDMEVGVSSSDDDDDITYEPTPKKKKRDNQLSIANRLNLSPASSEEDANKKNSTDCNQSQDEDNIYKEDVRPGIMDPALAKKYQMVELTPGSNVFLYPYMMHMMHKEKCSRMAKDLLGHFFDGQQLADLGSLTNVDLRIQYAIIAYVVKQLPGTQKSAVKVAMRNKFTGKNSYIKNAEKIKRRNQERKTKRQGKKRKFSDDSLKEVGKLCEAFLYKNDQSVPSSLPPTPVTSTDTSLSSAPLLPATSNVNGSTSSSARSTEHPSQVSSSAHHKKETSFEATHTKVRSYLKMQGPAPISRLFHMMHKNVAFAANDLTMFQKSLLVVSTQYILLESGLLDLVQRIQDSAIVHILNILEEKGIIGIKQLLQYFKVVATSDEVKAVARNMQVFKKILKLVDLVCVLNDGKVCLRPYVKQQYGTIQLGMLTSWFQKKASREELLACGKTTKAMNKTLKSAGNTFTIEGSCVSLNSEVTRQVPQPLPIEGPYVSLNSEVTRKVSQPFLTEEPGVSLNSGVMRQVPHLFPTEEPHLFLKSEVTRKVTQPLPTEESHASVNPEATRKVTQPLLTEEPYVSLNPVVQVLQPLLTEEPCVSLNPEGTRQVPHPLLTTLLSAGNKSGLAKVHKYLQDNGPTRILQLYEEMQTIVTTEEQDVLGKNAVEMMVSLELCAYPCFIIWSSGIVDIDIERKTIINEIIGFVENMQPCSLVQLLQQFTQQEQQCEVNLETLKTMQNLFTFDGDQIGLQPGVFSMLTSATTPLDEVDLLSSSSGAQRANSKCPPPHMSDTQSQEYPECLEELKGEVPDQSSVAKTKYHNTCGFLKTKYMKPLQLYVEENGPATRSCLKSLLQSSLDSKYYTVSSNELRKNLMRNSCKFTLLPSGRVGPNRAQHSAAQKIVKHLEREGTSDTKSIYSWFNEHGSKEEKNSFGTSEKTIKKKLKALPHIFCITHDGKCVSLQTTHLSKTDTESTPGTEAFDKDCNALLDLDDISFCPASLQGSVSSTPQAERKFYGIDGYLKNKYVRPLQQYIERNGPTTLIQLQAILQSEMASDKLLSIRELKKHLTHHSKKFTLLPSDLVGPNETRLCAAEKIAKFLERVGPSTVENVYKWFIQHSSDKEGDSLGTSVKSLKRNLKILQHIFLVNQKLVSLQFEYNSKGDKDGVTSTADNNSNSSATVVPVNAEIHSNLGVADMSEFESNLNNISAPVRDSTSVPDLSNIQQESTWTADVQHQYLQPRESQIPVPLTTYPSMVPTPVFQYNASRFACATSCELTRSPVESGQDRKEDGHQGNAPLEQVDSPSSILTCNDAVEKILTSPISEETPPILNPWGITQQLRDQFASSNKQEMDKLMALLGDDITHFLSKLADEPGEDGLDMLTEIILDCGRFAQARFYQPDAPNCSKDVTVSSSAITQEHIQSILDSDCVTPLTPDRRAGIEGTLHRLGIITNRSGRAIGLTASVGRAVLGCVDHIYDLIHDCQSVVMLGSPGIGMTTALREVARVLSDVKKRRVVVIDTYNQIGGDLDVPHACIGSARRLQIASRDDQYKAMGEAVQNHNPQTVIIDEFCTEAEAQAARNLVQRGVQVIAAAHARNFVDFFQNPNFNPVTGMVQGVAESEGLELAEESKTSATKRLQEPAFQVLIELIEKDRWKIHRDLATSIGFYLQGKPPLMQDRRLSRKGALSDSHC